MIDNEATDYTRRVTAFRIALRNAASGLLLAAATGCVASQRETDAEPAPSAVSVRPPSESGREWFIQPDWHERLSGRFEFEDGRPAAGVGYALNWIDHPPDAANWWNPRTTGAGGRFAVGRLPRGTFQIAVEPPWKDTMPDVAAAIVGPFQAGADDLVVRVRPGRTVSGFVVMKDGTGVEGAVVEIGPRPHTGIASIRWIPTAEDGSFTTSHAAHGPLYVHVDARDVGRGRRERLVVDLGPIDPSAAPIQVVLDAGLSIEGTLSLPDGAAKCGVCLVAVTPSDPAPLRDDAPWNGCRTDEHGHFEIRGLTPGVYEVWAWPWNNPLSGSSWSSSWGHSSVKALDGPGGTPAGTSGLKLTWATETCFDGLGSDDARPEGDPPRSR